MKLVLEIKYGGLGDHLFYSHLPRIAKESKKYTKVYISNFSEFRHQDYKKLIWDLNPYIDGYIDEAGFIPNFSKIDNNMNILDKIMLEFGIDDGIRFHEPEIYYKPNFVEKFNKIIYDPNYVSYVGRLNKFKMFFYFYFNNLLKINQLKIRNKKALSIYFNRNFIETVNLEDFCDLIHSSKKLYCLTSGTATLAAALKKPSFVFYGPGQNKMFHHSSLHKYIKL